jgi:hypothetical protein
MLEARLHRRTRGYSRLNVVADSLDTDHRMQFCHLPRCRRLRTQRSRRTHSTSNCGRTLNAQKARRHQQWARGLPWSCKSRATRMRSLTRFHAHMELPRLPGKNFPVPSPRICGLTACPTSLLLTRIADSSVTCRITVVNSSEDKRFCAGLSTTKLR